MIANNSMFCNDIKYSLLFKSYPFLNAHLSISFQLAFLPYIKIPVR
jgi:hypothetical protein